MADCIGSPAIVALGLGNLLLGDDGVGVHAVRLFSQSCPNGVLAVEVGTAILNAEHLLEDADYILTFDAMKAGGRPGDVYVASLDAVADEYAGSASVHDLTLVSVMRHLRRRPRQALVIAAEPETIDIGMELTPRLREALPSMLAAATAIVETWRSWNPVRLAGVVPTGMASARHLLVPGKPAPSALRPHSRPAVLSFALNSQRVRLKNS